MDLGILRAISPLPRNHLWTGCTDSIQYVAFLGYEWLAFFEDNSTQAADPPRCFEPFLQGLTAQCDMLLESNLWNYADGCDHGFTPCFSAQGLADGTTVGRRAEEVPGISDGAKTWVYLINCFRSSERSTSWILLVFSGSLYIYLDTMHSSMVLVYRMYVYCSTNCYTHIWYMNTWAMIYASIEFSFYESRICRWSNMISLAASKGVFDLPWSL